MQPEPTTPRKRGLIERATLVTLVGLSVLSVLGVATVSIYLNRISESTAGLTRARIMPGYAGRPDAVVGANGNAAVNYLIMVSSDGTLNAVVVANLSASRRNLTLITVPADLLNNATNGQTLATTYAVDPAITSRTMEGLTDARMDHQILLDWDRFGAVVDAMGGVSLGGNELTGAEAVALVAEAPDAQTAADNCGAVLRAALLAADDYSNLMNPSKMNQMIAALSDAVTLDSTLTNQVIKNTVVESSVHLAETQLWPVKTDPSLTGAGATPDTAALSALQSALDTPNLAETQQYQQAAYIPREANR